MLISFEGIDSSGKETQCRMLAEKLRSQGKKVETLSFPDYNTPLGKAIREFLVDGFKVDDETAAMLFAVDRRQHNPEITKLLEQEYILLTDRYKYSNFAFFRAKGLDKDWLIQLDSKIPESDLVILMDLSPSVSVLRKEEKDKFEKDEEYLTKVRAVYLELAAEKQWVVIDATQSFEEIHEKVMQAVNEVLK